MNEEIDFQLATSGNVAKLRGLRAVNWIIVKGDNGCHGIGVAEIDTDKVILVFTLHEDERVNSVAALSPALPIIIGVRLAVSPHIPGAFL